MPKRLLIPLCDNGGGVGCVDTFAAFLSAFRGLNYAYARMSDSHPGRLRNKATSAFLASDCDEMLMLDLDIVGFDRKYIDMICEHDEPIVGGVYFKKGPGMQACVCPFDGQHWTPEPGEVLSEVRRTGAGFLKISREVFEALKEENGGPSKVYYNHGQPEWDFWPSGVFEPPMAMISREWLSEDWGMLELARSVGYKVYIDTRITLRHRGWTDFPL